MSSKRGFDLKKIISITSDIVETVVEEFERAEEEKLKEKEQNELSDLKASYVRLQSDNTRLSNMITSLNVDKTKLQDSVRKLTEINEKLQKDNQELRKLSSLNVNTEEDKALPDEFKLKIYLNGGDFEGMTDEMIELNYNTLVQLINDICKDENLTLKEFYSNYSINLPLHDFIIYMTHVDIIKSLDNLERQLTTIILKKLNLNRHSIEKRILIK